MYDTVLHSHLKLKLLSQTDPAPGQEIRQLLANDPVGISYVFGCGGKGQGAVCDPINDPELYLRIAEGTGLKIIYVIDTHLHADHVSGGRKLAEMAGPCLSEMPMFSQRQKQYGADKFQVIGVSMDDTAAPVAATKAKLKLNYPVVMGDEHLGAAYGGVLGLPVTFLIDRDGRIRATYEGAADLAHIQSDIQNLLRSH